MILLSLIFGLFVGMILGLLGSGGAIISIPILIYGLGFSIKEAVPISLMAISLSSIIGSSIAFKQGHIRYKAAILIAITGSLIAPLGIFLGYILPENPIKALFGLTLLYIAFKNIFSKNLHGGQRDNSDPDSFPCEMNPDHGKLIWTKKCASSLIFTGGITGVMSGLLGVGGGFVIIPALRKFSNIPLKQITSTSVGVIAIISTVSLILYLLKGDVHLSQGIPFAVGSLIGMLVVKKISQMINSSLILKVFSILILIVGIALIFNSLFS